MNVADPRPIRSRSVAATRLEIVDCDIHPARATLGGAVSLPGNSAGTSTSRPTARGAVTAMLQGPPYPKAQPQASRRDAWPPGGGPPASDLDLHAAAASRRLRRQARHPESAAPTGQGDCAMPDLAGAIAPRSTNGSSSTGPRKRSAPEGLDRGALRGRVPPPPRDPQRAGDTHFAQVLLLSRTGEPLGQRRYWPIYEAARRGRPAGRHPRLRLSAAGRSPPRGWPLTTSRR